MSDVVRADVAPGVRTITLQRSARANALSAALVDALHAAIDDAIKDDVRAVILGADGKHFCAGFDLSDFDDASEADLVWRMLRIGYLLERLYTAPFATIAAVQGPAVGAGADLVAACDQRIFTPDVKVRFPGTAFGVVLGTARLASLTSQSFASAVVTAGSTICAIDAREHGIATHIVDSAELSNTARETAETYASITRPTLDGVLRATRPQLSGSLNDLTLSLVSQPGIKQRLRTYLDQWKGQS